jgi:hypothetical protein
LWWLARPVRSSIALLLIFSGLPFHRRERRKHLAKSGFVRTAPVAQASACVF